MSFDVTTSVAIGQATKVSDYARLAASIKALAGISHYLGGDLSSFISDTTYTNLTTEWLEWEIDGTNLSGLSVYLEVNVKAHPDNSGTVTVSVQLFNVTTTAAVASSEVAVAALAAGARAHSKSSAITLATGINKYKAQIKTSDAAKLVSGVARVSIRG
jgi:hypothetical protein